MTPLSITIVGKPQPKERARQGRTRAGKAIWYTPERTRRYQRAVATAALLARQTWQTIHGTTWPLDASYEVWVSLTFRDRRIADGDNCLKSVLDGAEGVLWRNDRQVVSKHVWRTAPSKVDEGVRVEVRLVKEVALSGDPTEPFLTERA